MAVIERRGRGYRAKVRLKGVPPLSAAFERLTDARRWAQQTEAAIREGRYFRTKSIAAEICSAAKEATPLLTAEAFSALFADGRPFSPLRKEYGSYDFQPGNYVLRHLFAHFLAFQEDKFKRPEFFCWPGAWTAGENVSEVVMDMFDKHGALFVDKEDHDGVFPRIQKWPSEIAVQMTFDAFYHNQILYDLANQWISNPGVFTYDFDWLAPSRAEEVREFLRKQFTNLYGMDPESVHVLESAG